VPGFSGPVAQPEMEGFEGSNDNKNLLTLSDSVYANFGAQETSWRETVGGLSEEVNDTSAVYIYRKIDLQLYKWLNKEVNGLT